MSAATVLLYDFDPAGHHPQWLTRCGQAMVQAGHKVILAAPLGDRRLAHWQGLLPQGPQVQWVETTCTPKRHSGPLALIEAEELRQKHGAQAVFFTYLDAVISQPLQARRWDVRWPSRLHGIWMGPRALEPGWIWRTPISGFARRIWSEQKGLARLKGQRRLGWLGLLDGQLVQSKKWVGVADVACELPDPAEPVALPARAVAREQWKIPANAQVFLHFGTDEPRKGLADAALAMAHMPANAACLLLRAGSVGSRQGLQKPLGALRAQGRLMLIDRFIEEEEIPSLLAACDWVLLPYRNHLDSSGVLSLATQAGRAVIASDHGLLGRRVQAFGAGLVYPHLSVKGLGRAMRQAQAMNVAALAPGLAADAAAHTLAAFQQRLACSWREYCSVPCPQPVAVMA